jgi:hypothetical protein
MDIRTLRNLCVLLCCVALPCGRALCAVGPPAVSVRPDVIRLPVTDANDIRFSHLSGSHGLSQRRVTNILQDRQGFMWFGTQYGLNRYDGYRFKVFKHEPDDPHSLSGVSVYALFLYYQMAVGSCTLPTPASHWACSRSGQAHGPLMRGCMAANRSTSESQVSTTYSAHYQPGATHRNRVSHTHR